MRSVSILSLASLLAVSAAAQPVVERDMVTVTKIETVVKTIDVTSTVYADGSAATPSAPVNPPVEPSHHQHHSHHHAHPTSSQDPPPPPPTSTLSTSTPEPVTPTTTPTPTPTPEPTTSSPPAAPTSTQAPGGGSGAPANAFTGEMTFYTPGLGSCGITNTETDFIVALAVDKMNNPANPNDNPLCNQKITIQYGGVTKTATVTDTCQACALDDLDMTPTLFSAFADQSKGRVGGVKWWFDDASLM